MWDVPCSIKKAFMAHRSLAPQIEHVARQSVASTIVDFITQSLLSKKLKPGDKLPTEWELTQALKVGRNSVREAVKMLSSLGVIEIRRGVGTFIPTSMKASMLNPIIMGLVYKLGGSVELWELRVLVETGVVELAIQKATAEDIQELKRANERIKDTAEHNGSDSILLRDLDLAFHGVLLKATKNSLVEELGQAIYQLFFASIEKSVAGDPIRAYHNHRLLTKAIEDRQADKARTIVTESLAHWTKVLKEEEPGRRKEVRRALRRTAHRVPPRQGGA